MKKKLFIRVRLVIIKENKLLVYYTKKDNFYFYIGGKLEHGETLEQGWTREIKEECGEDAVFTFKKILYIRDFIKQDEHNLELYILGDLNKFKEIEGRK